MRISDWSSDVCSSDLGAHQPSGGRGDLRPARPARAAGGRGDAARSDSLRRRPAGARPALRDRRVEDRARAGLAGGRSEEHTSELQSLMRISYAVFCLKKKKLTISHNDTQAIK